MVENTFTDRSQGQQKRYQNREPRDPRDIEYEKQRDQLTFQPQVNKPASRGTDPRKSAAARPKLYEDHPICVLTVEMDGDHAAEQLKIYQG